MDTIPLVFCFIGVGAVLIGFLRVAHVLFEGEPPARETIARLKRAREQYTFFVLPAFLAGSVIAIFVPEDEGRLILLASVLFFAVFYYIALRDIRKAVRST